MKEKIIGQDIAVDSLAAALRRKRLGWADPDKPQVFLFLGASGVGKTELSKALANELDRPPLRFDMREYLEKIHANKFLALPGYEEGGQLTENLRKNPEAVALLDEIEKAHVDLLPTLLQGKETSHGSNCADALKEFMDNKIMPVVRTHFQREKNQ